MERLICIVIGYALGLIQTGYICGKVQNIDIRDHGSGNAGTTNTLRTLGWKAGLITLLGDCFKCVAAVAIAKALFPGEAENLFGIYAAFGVILGHNYPFYLKFQGGKGIASTAGLIISTNWIMVLTCATIFSVTVAITKYVSLGSILVMIAYIIQVVIFGQMGMFDLSGPLLYEYYAIAVILTVMAIFRHRKNIVRLLNGTENKLGADKK